MRPRVVSVSALVREVNLLLEQGFSGLHVEGEITNASRSARGHLYFSLKDSDAAVDCVMWAGAARRLRFEPEDGLAVTAAGSLTVYPPRGRLQLVVEQLEPLGIGALQLAFEQLKSRLAAEGLFDADRKRPLPLLPSRVGLVTSLGGAALRDAVKVLRRSPQVSVVVAPATVQGDAAAAEIADALARLGASGLVDVVLLVRGGGSLEDLWAFNLEPVARAIAACPVPVVTGVGHETDFTIADFVADHRAATPTHAAETVVARVEAVVRRLDTAVAAMVRAPARGLGLARARLRGAVGSSGLARVPERVRRARQRFDRWQRLAPLLRAVLTRSRNRLAAADAGLARVPTRVAAGGHRRLLASRSDQLGQLMRARLQRELRQLEGLRRALAHLSPRAVLERGYSITTRDGDPAPLRDAAGVRSGEVLTTTLARGRLRSVVAGHGGRRTAAGDRATGDQRSLFAGAPREEP